MPAHAPQKRLRLRNPLLTQEKTGRDLTHALASAPGIFQVKVNPRVGSILVLFDPVMTNTAAILDCMSDTLSRDCRKWLKKANPHGLNNKKMRRLVKFGLLTSIGAAVGALAFSERTHIIAGSAFLGLAALHGYQNRRTLLR
ncbi:MAG: hypothetical protein V6Z89_18925 [Desulfobacter sp.]